MRSDFDLSGEASTAQPRYSYVPQWSLIHLLSLTVGIAAWSIAPATPALQIGNTGPQVVPLASQPQADGEAATVRYDLQTEQTQGTMPDPSTVAPVLMTSPPPLMLSQAVTDGLYLQLDDSGEAVTALQTRLAELGYYDGPITGYYGPLTEEAIIQFQQASGLTADGIVGPSTTEALRQAGRQPVPVVLQLDDSGNMVTTLQNRLAELGYYDGPITGYYGSLTQDAVIRFQQTSGLTADGIVGATTEAALRSASRTPVSQGFGPVSATAGDSAVASGSTTVDDGLLRQGSIGPAVTDLQVQLRDLGYYSGPIDGDFGPSTEAAVLQFQQAQGLTPDGIVGPSTLAAIANPAASVQQQPAFTSTTSSTAVPFNSGSSGFSSGVVAAPPAAPQPDRTVLELQRRLRERGFYSGPLDGLMGPQTREAISAAQLFYQINGQDIAN